MERFVYASLILPGETERIRQKKRDEKPYYYQEERKMFWEAIGLASWACFLQHLEGKDYFIHVLEGESLETIFSGLRREIRAQNPQAMKVRAFNLEVLGKDYLQEATMPKLEKVFDLTLEEEKGPIVERLAYIYPLLPHKDLAQKAYCEKAMGEKKEEILQMYRATGIQRMEKWIQRSAEGDYIVYFQERTKHYERKRRPDDPILLKRLATLMDHTGLTAENLFPDVEQLMLAPQPSQGG